MSIEEFKKALKEMGIEYTENQITQLEIYDQLLMEWNEKINLTTIIEKEQVYLKHFYDSLTLTKIADLKEQKTFCDIGTGAGFPGIVIKIFYPHLHVTLVDSLEKRIKFLNDVIDQLHLKDIEVYHARAEEFACNHREKYDIVTARAVAHLSTILEYGMPMVKIGKYLIAMKGNIEEELLESQNAGEILNCRLENKLQFELPFHMGSRTLLLFQKMKTTNLRYPRKYSEMKKKRL